MAEDRIRNDDEEPGEGASAPDAQLSTADASPVHDVEGGDAESGELPGDDDTAASAAGSDHHDPYWMVALNRRIEGRLVLAYPTRSVVVACDGDAALRVLALLAGSRQPGLRDRLDPVVSTAATGWIVVDPDVLAAIWEPGVGEGPAGSRRIVVDPVPAPLGRTTLGPT